MILMDWKIGTDTLSLCLRGCVGVVRCRVSGSLEVSRTLDSNDKRQRTTLTVDYSPCPRSRDLDMSQVLSTLAGPEFPSGHIAD
jgi:hypothetical protein